MSCARNPYPQRSPIERGRERWEEYFDSEFRRELSGSGMRDQWSFLMMITDGDLYVTNVGESLDLKCDFHADNFDLFHYPVLWLKTQTKEESQINIMGNINEPFLATDRYSVDFTEASPRFVLELHIKDLRPEDSGNYTCQIRGPQSVILKTITHSVYVRTPVDHILITDTRNISLINMQANSPSTVTFIENQSATLRCLALGGNPPPSMEVYIGRDHLTQQFSFSNSARMTGEKGMRVLSYLTQRWSHNFNVGLPHNNKKLRCSVAVPGLQPVTESIKIIVYYKPRIACTSASAYIGDKNLKLTCEIRSNPPATKMFWLLDENETMIRPGEVANEYWSNIEDEHSGTTQIYLFMKQARDSSFRGYSLTAENNVGVETRQRIERRRNNLLSYQTTNPTEKRHRMTIVRTGKRRTNSNTELFCTHVHQHAQLLAC
ncbi:hypothetical protein CAPTEDRAFT_223749 [Capitella teleta]|uniref:Ig-like domain-containing protein n=1 Tax=Capitella teleta TaxID=283909 RepID=R7T880_CAPTE|nr:hypothetical protein CAPTEDRAFT_223749 [Capitella teleta]|eukprot:ELT89879.1 hypothetical protein CAPTEDRAFT_223749 [Capitella teleta]